MVLLKVAVSLSLIIQGGSKRETKLMFNDHTQTQIDRQGIKFADRAFYCTQGCEDGLFI